jgi:hypothetical protein
MLKLLGLTGIWNYFSIDKWVALSIEDDTWATRMGAVVLRSCGVVC